MRLIAITRVLNEADIIEAFARHTAHFVDHHVFLDNGSHDGTVEILQALRDGVGGIDLLQVHTVSFCEHLHNTMLYRIAASAGADWVCCLDADEFLRPPPNGSLRAALATVPPELEAVTLPLVNYYTTPQDDPAERLVPARLRHRIRTPHDVPKMFIRGALPDAQVLDGNHSAIVEGRAVRMAPLPGISLAHFHTRAGVQMLAKAVIGRLKVLAGGAEAGPDTTSGHYTSFLQIMRDNPGHLLGDPNFMGGGNAGLDLVEDPIAYCGAPLTLTPHVDANLHAVRALAHAAEALARSHGRFLDENAALRPQVRLWRMEVRRL